MLSLLEKAGDEGELHPLVDPENIAKKFSNTAPSNHGVTTSKYQLCLPPEGRSGIYSDKQCRLYSNLRRRNKQVGDEEF